MSRRPIGTLELIPVAAARRVAGSAALELHAESTPRLAALPPEERNEYSTALAIMHFPRALGILPAKPDGQRPSGSAADHKPRE
jgi:hypothetical protein